MAIITSLNTLLVFLCLSWTVVTVTNGAPTTENLSSCYFSDKVIPLGQQVRVTPTMICSCTQQSLDAGHFANCWMTPDSSHSQRKRLLLKSYDTPAPPVVTSKMSTKAPPPFTTLAPPDPNTTDGPSAPTIPTKGTTRSPPPPVVVG